MASTVWRGYISFGLISIPVRLFRAARPERVSLRRLYRQSAAGSMLAENDESAPEARPAEPVAAAASGRGIISSRPSVPALRESVGTLTPVRQASVREETDNIVQAADVVKGYEYEKNRFVAVEAEELKSIAPKTSSAMEIEEFVKLAEIDPVYFETSYYVTPEEAGEKAYGLLYRAMLTTGLVAIAQFAMHSREHAVVLRPGRHGLLAHTMFYASEVHADEEYNADASAIGAKELELAQTLINSLEASFEPEKYRDQYRERLESMLARKVKGEPVAPLPTAPRQAPVVDIAEALRQSLANLKKPAAIEETGRKKAQGR